MDRFQSTHPRGVRPPLYGRASPSGDTFQSTHPRGVRQDQRGRCAFHHAGFNPRTRVGCDVVVDAQCNGRPVSIHAPAWGATRSHHRSFSWAPVSIHAPAWGATRAAHGRGHGCAGFNPRTRVGCDFFFYYASARQCWVSIHAPAWGATTWDGEKPVIKTVSIHAPAWGATVRMVLTPLHSSGFNPRTRVGCDRHELLHRKTFLWFQSTHPRGVRLFEHLLPCRVHVVSIHAPAWGATGITVLAHETASLFQSTHPRGVRRRDEHCIDLHKIGFQSTHPRGVRRSEWF